jgi:TM2 domain-containing membrane protein YozV
VHSNLPDVDNISTAALPIFLLLFFMSWLIWSQDISKGVHVQDYILKSPTNTLTEEDARLKSIYYTSPRYIQGFGFIMISGVSTGIILFWFDDITSIPVMALGIGAAIVFAILSLFRRDIIVYIFNKKNLDITAYEKQFMLLFRWMVEVVILTTIHASLPTVLNSAIATTYRNSIGFLMGSVLCFAGGRDISWALFYNFYKTRPSFLVRLMLFFFYLTAAAIVGIYVCVCMVGSVFISSVELEQEKTTALLVSMSVVVQSFAFGSIYALYNV